MPTDFRKKWITTGLITGLALAIGCAGPSANEQGLAALESSEQSLRLSDFSTRELVIGLMLMDGPAAQLVPTIRDNWALELHITDPSQLAAHREFTSHVVDKLLADHPEPVRAFREGILSGNHIATQKSIEDTRVRLRSIAKPYVLAEQSVSADADRGLCIYQYAYFDFDRSFSFDFVLPPYLYVYFGSREDDKLGLLSEQAVDEIVSLANASN